MTLSQLLQGSDIEFNPILDSTNAPQSNNGSQYSQYDSTSKTLTISVNTEDNLVVQNITNPSNPTQWVYQWYDKLNDDLDTAIKSNNDLKWSLTINAPKSIITIKSNSNLKESPKIGEGGESTLKIQAKELHIGDGTQTYSDLFGEPSPSQVYIMKQGSIIQSDVIVNQDGILNIGNQGNSLSHFVLDGNLTINGGGLAIAAMGGENPTFDVNGKVKVNNAKFRTFVNTEGEMQNLRIVGSRDGISIEGNNTVQADLSFYLQDFVSIDESHKDYGWAYQSSIDLYEYSLRIEGNTLYATPELAESAKRNGVVELINNAKNDIAMGFYNMVKVNNNDPELAKALLAYLQSQGIDPSFSYTLLASTPKSSSTTPTTTGFDNIDSKLSIIKDGANNSLAESIKNSNNNLLAVNFVNTMMQGYNNTPIELLNEVKSNLSMSASISSFLRNDLHTSLALASRFASFSFAPKSLEENTQSSEYPLISQAAGIQPSTSESLSSNSLWANAFGGANLLGSEVGASYGLNLGYDKNLENALVGTYLSYEYATLAPSLLTLNAHNIKLGVYSRIQEGGNEIDVELSSLLSIISQESATKALDSKSSADYLSSLTELKTTYGYALLEGDFKLKPLVGLALSFSYTPSFKEEGDILIDFSSFYNFNASIQAGLEFRANFSNKGFLYTLLSIEQDLYNSLDSLSINSQSLPITQDLKTYAQVLLGGEIAISKDWNIVLSLGAKQSIVGSKDYEDKTINETYISGSVGVGYRF